MSKITLMGIVMISALMSASLTLAAPADKPHQKQGQQQVQQGKQKSQPAKKSQYKSGSPSRGWQRGDQVPKSYNGGKSYQVSNWKAHNLSRPPQGKHWLKVDGNFILVSISSGIISTIIYR